MCENNYYSLFKYLDKEMESHNFGVYRNLGATIDDFTKEMSDWAKGLEAAGLIAHKWCISDGKIQVIGNVDLRGRTIDYPFGVVAGFFYCDDSERSSVNFPEHIGCQILL